MGTAILARLGMHLLYELVDGRCPDGSITQTDHHMRFPKSRHVVGLVLKMASPSKTAIPVPVALALSKTLLHSNSNSTYGRDAIPKWSIY